jgi:tetratricopeptide (TPR) repeat protein
VSADLQTSPERSSSFRALHNRAVGYARSGFVEPALEMYDRALRMANDDTDRQLAYASMSAAYHGAALCELDPLEQHRLLHDGLYAATAALDPKGAVDTIAAGEALAHRAMMLAEIGHFHAAIDDARRVFQLAAEHGLRSESALAIIAEAMAQWGLHRDPAVHDVIRRAKEAAEGLELQQFTGPLYELEEEVAMAAISQGDPCLGMPNRRAIGDVAVEEVR